MKRDKLRRARLKKGLSQDVAAGLVGVSRTTWSMWETGMSHPYPMNVKDLCAFFGVSDPADLDLLSEAEQPESQTAHLLSPTKPIDERADTRTTVTSLPEIGPHLQERRVVSSPQTITPPSGLEDVAAWFGRKLASLLTLTEDSCGERTRYQELQESIGKELNSMHPKSDDAAYTLSRRQLLITLATLPTALLTTFLQRPSSTGRIEQFLARCATSVAACWHLMRGCEYSTVDDLLSSYLPLLAHMAQEVSVYQHTAASLATQGYRLKGIVALHRNDITARDAAFQHAVLYAERALHPGFLVAALISLAYHLHSPAEAEQLYRKALLSEDAVSPLQRSRLYAELAIASAQQNNEQEALRYLSVAQTIYPEHPEDDPAFLYAEFSPASLILEQGRAHLALSHHRPDGYAAHQAWETFACVKAGSSMLSISERIRYEIINYQAETALALQDRDRCCDYLEQGAQGAILLKSERRRREVIIVRKQALKRWPQEKRVLQLKEFFE